MVRLKAPLFHFQGYKLPLQFISHNNNNNNNNNNKGQIPEVTTGLNSQ
jgi:hypothetical protein